MLDVVDFSMSPEQKIEAIRKYLADIDRLNMTEAELDIWQIVTERKATLAEKRQSKVNSGLILES